MTKAILAITVALAACDLDYQPDVGPLHASEDIPADASESSVDATAGTDAAVTATIGRCDDNDPATNVSYAASIRPLFIRSPGGCNTCHGTSATSGFAVGSYESLRRGGTVSGTRIIIDGKPCDSILFQKLGPAPPFGSRMPYNGPPYWTAAERGLLRDWIAEGAQNN
jgi:hypothetical protein